LVACEPEGLFQLDEHLLFLVRREFLRTGNLGDANVKSSLCISFPHKLAVFPFDRKELFLEHLLCYSSVLQQLEPSSRKNDVSEELDGDEELDETQCFFVVYHDPDNLGTHLLACEC